MNDFIVAMIAQAAMIEADRIDVHNELNDVDSHTDIENKANQFWYNAMLNNPFMKG